MMWIGPPPRSVQSIQYLNDIPTSKRLCYLDRWTDTTTVNKRMRRPSKRLSWTKSRPQRTFGSVHPADGAFDAIAAAVSDQASGGPQTRLYVPLTVGRHVSSTRASRCVDVAGVGLAVFLRRLFLHRSRVSSPWRTVVPSACFSWVRI